MKIMKIIHIVLLFFVIIFFFNCAFGQANKVESVSNTMISQNTSSTAQPVTSPSPTSIGASQASPTSITKQQAIETPVPTVQAVTKKKSKKTTVKTEIKTATKTDKIKSFIKKLIQEQKDRKALTAKISIKTTYIDANMTQKVKGDVMIKKPDKFLVHYTEPNEQEMISDGTTLWIYTPKLSQVIKQNIKDANLNMHFYIDLETSIAFFAQNSKTKLDEQDPDYYRLKMIPLHKKDMEFDELNVKIGKKDLLPVYMSMKMENTLVEVEFSDIETYTAAQAAEAPELKDEKFVFKTPEGVEEVDGSSLTGVEGEQETGTEKKNKGEEK